MDGSHRKTIYENIHALRQKPETCKLGLKYCSESDAEIMVAAEQGTPIHEIAKAQKRTPRAIQIRIINIALGLMKRYNLSLEDVSRRFHINPTLLSRHYQRMVEKEHHVRSFVRNAVK